LTLTSPPESSPVLASDPVVPPRAHEIRMLLLIAGPLIAAYLSEFVMALTTKAIVGKLGYVELASIGLASDMTAEIIVILVGLLSVTGVLVAQADGADLKADAGIAARQGLIIATAIGIPASVLVWHLDKVLALTGQSAEIIDPMSAFLQPLSFAILPTLWFFSIRTFVASLAKTGAVLVITLAAVGLNYVLCRGFVEGVYGLPELGLAGAGLAKAIVAVFMLISLVTYTYLTPTFRGYGLFLGRLKIDPSVCGEILRLGLPVAGIVILEASLFAAVSIFSGILGAVPLATYQVMIAWVGIAFVSAHGLAEAGMVRIAHNIGRGSLPGARQAGILTFLMGIVVLIALAIFPITFPRLLVETFLSADDPGFNDVLTMTTRLLVLAACFQVFDGLQVMAALALRGLRDTVIPLWIAGLGYWVFGIAGGWLLAFPAGFGVDGLWWGMAVGLTVTGSLLALRFLVLTARPDNLPAPSAPEQV